MKYPIISAQPPDPLWAASLNGSLINKASKIDCNQKTVTIKAVAYECFNRASVSLQARPSLVSSLYLFAGKIPAHFGFQHVGDENA